MKLRGLLLALTLAGCASGPTPPARTPIDETAFVSLRPAPRLIADVPIERAPGAPKVIFMGGLDMTGDPHPMLHGLSDLKVDTDGEILAVTDIGRWVRMRPRLSSDGRLIGISSVSAATITDRRGEALTLRPRDYKNFNRWADAEGLALLREGPLVSFEHEQRIWLYPGPGASAKAASKPFPLPPDENSGFEAIAADGVGGYWVAAESGGVWRCRVAQGCRQAAAPPAVVPDDPELRVVSMDLDPQGDGVLVLERGWSRAEGTRVRVSRWRPVEDARAPLRLEPLFELPRSQNVANFEGLAAVRTGSDGRGTRLYLVSDDNVDARQLNQLLAFDLR